MTVHRLDRMTWEDVAALPKSRTIFFLSLGPIEEHGPHLPLGTDFYGAADTAAMAVNLLEERDPSPAYVLMPGLPVGCAKSMTGFPGTISLKSQTLTALLYDVGSSLAEHGFQYIVIANHHLDLLHVKAIMQAISLLEEKYDIKVVEVPATLLFSGNMPKDDLLEAMGCDAGREMHADVRETSFIKSRYPELLRECYQSLPPVHIDIQNWMKKGLPRVETMGATKGYVGSPSLATAEYGEHYLATGAALVADLAWRLFRNESIPRIGERMMRVLDNLAD